MTLVDTTPFMSTEEAAGPIPFALRPTSNPFQTWTPVDEEQPVVLRVLEGAPTRRVMYLTDRFPLVDLRLLHPVRVDVGPSSEGRYELFAAPLGLGGVGDTLESAAADLATTVQAMWYEFVEVDPTSITDDGARVAQRLRTAFARR